MTVLLRGILLLAALQGEARGLRSDAQVWNPPVSILSPESSKRTSVLSPQSSEPSHEFGIQVVGTSGRVVNEVKVGTESQIDARDNADDQLEEHLTKSFKEAKEWDMDKLDLNFNVEAGVVTITGDAPSQAVKDRVTAAVKQMDGVKDVVNNLEIAKRRRLFPAIAL